MASVTYDHVWKKYGDVVAVQDLNLAIEDKEFLVLVGPSGCGKTTALRCLAGLEEITQGEVRIGDQVVNDVAPKDRDIAMVFQSYALYPHMSVYDNMAFGLKLRKMPKDEIDRRVKESARILGIEGFLKRKPKELSGGQRQRVAVGRAIVREPKVFLFDEPLSNLDAKLRVQTRAEISKLHKNLQTTFIYVTHDQTEAMTMATRIAVMSKAKLQQLDTPQNLYDHPANLFVAGFIGSPAMNFFKGKLIQSDGHFVADLGSFSVKLPDQDKERYVSVVDKEIIFGIRPEDIHNPLYAPPGIIAEPVDVKVDVTELMGNEIFLYLVNGEHNFIARVDPRTTARFGDEMQVVFNMDNYHIFDPSIDAENPPVV
ncbi:MAG TPA: sn-glycerol-3-phosphate ABC transporter ATP-binding protein UgpC [Anaerolineaceae bacterium]|jgi:multiple sugar transport system ATP-binding protein|nr:sn-glycerol-3-phosphate ABC transporter ATP-binding protein UgpC [Anaerolineaceae bacterium]HOE34544.1 sn-glycerol-3-phosphate ABC transporter ATP-binding protein UgpC [Anaerolineaceae bacterium]HOT25042.1 sn-glycerol-3-phosphate ABC transporter ATP-binding protein UgpC [Anaerolineaceae bacterium]HQH57694.1 sn-glycerol-3-phosphate ABC transporter ATP-binding protein UgpC [Anaerolineaceae bacterium]HQK03465.1 sn-glycerol-3-phosphate ABC transporter ATP-binding protein UgpC [Anaerolineaceae ba